MVIHQTRASTRLAAKARAATSSVTVTPSPKKKPKVQHNDTNVLVASSSSSSPPKIERRTLFQHDDDTKVREKVQNLIQSSICICSSSSSSSSSIKTETMGGWCLVDGLAHCMTASDGILKEMIETHGPPDFLKKYLQTGKTSTRGKHEDGYQSFRSLCRTVASQQLAGPAANTIWARFLGVIGASPSDTTNLTPRAILSIVDNGDVEDDLRKPAGLSNAKCNCIIALSEAFNDGELSDSILSSAPDEEVYQKLQQVKGIGPWTVDMFLLFECHRQNILPIGDLAVRNGTSILWKVKGKGKGGAVCPKKNKDEIELCHEPFAPYRSISTYYMYKLVDKRETKKDVKGSKT